MSDNGNNPAVSILVPAAKRARASWPILLLAVLFLTGAFLTWYFTWFGRELSEADISEYLVDDKHSRKVQHALLQIQQRIERRDPSARQWYPRLILLASHPETEIRLTVAWLMGSDNQAQEFHDALSKMLTDAEPIVRRNAALALVNFRDDSGRQELRSILEPYPVKTTAEGMLSSSLRSGSHVSRGSLLARVQIPDKQTVELRSPLIGEVQSLTSQSGTNVRQGDVILSLRSDEASVWEALRALALIGRDEEIALIQHYLGESPEVSARIKEQAAQTIKSIQSRESVR